MTATKELDVDMQPYIEAKCPTLPTATESVPGNFATAAQFYAVDGSVALDTICGPQPSITGDSTCIWGGRSVIPGLDAWVSRPVTNHLLGKANRLFARPLISMTDPVLLNPEKGWPESYLSP